MILCGRIAVFAATINLPQRTMGALRQQIGIALGLKAVFPVTPIAGLSGFRRAPLADAEADAPAPVAIRAPLLLSSVRSA